MRASYYGSSKTAKWLLRSGSKVSGRAHRDFGTSYWSSDFNPEVYSASTSLNESAYGKERIVDGDMYSYYLSASSSGVNVVLDLGTSRWIKELRMLPLGDSNSPKRCLLQRSMTSGIGPFETVTSFTVAKIVDNSTGSNYTTSKTHVIGFNGHARYWRLIVIDNYGGAGVGIRELSLHGYNEEIAVIPFELSNTGDYTNYYHPFLPLSSPIYLDCALN